MKAYPVKFEVREADDGWQLFALPCHNVGWAPIAMTPPRGTPGGALVEFASALYRLTVDEGGPFDARFTPTESATPIGSATQTESEIR